MKTTIRVQFKDVDLSKRIHYSAIFPYFEVADHEFFRSIGYPYKELFEKGYHLPRVHVECDYKEHIYYDDLLEISTNIERIGNSSFSYRFDFFRDDLLVAVGKMTMVFINDALGKSIPIPSDIREQLQKHLI